MENPIKMDDLGVPLFLETPISGKLVPLNRYVSFQECYGCMVIIFGSKQPAETTGSDDK